MSEPGQKFVLWSKKNRPAREGTVLDIDTGILRRDHVLVLRSPQAEITLGLGSVAGELMNFAHEGETRGNALLDACHEADRAIARGDLATSRALGVPDVITTIENRARRRLALVECFLSKASPDDSVHPGYPAGAPDGKGGQFSPKDNSNDGEQEASGKDLLVPVSDKLSTKEIGNIVYNETRSLSGPSINDARVAIANAVRNGEDAQGERRPLSAPSDVDNVPTAESGTYQASQDAATQADSDREKGTDDPSESATHFLMTYGPSTTPFKGNAYIKSYGPFDNSYPNKQVPSRTGVYINFYK